MAATIVFAGSYEPVPPLEQLLACVTDGLARTPGAPATFALMQRMQSAWGPWAYTAPSSVAPTAIDQATGQVIHYRGYELHARTNYRQDGHPVFHGGALLQLQANILRDGGRCQLELGFTDNFYPPFALDACESLVHGTVVAIARTLRERIFGPSFPMVLELAFGTWRHAQLGFANAF